MVFTDEVEDWLLRMCWDDTIGFESIPEEVQGSLLWFFIDKYRVRGSDLLTSGPDEGPYILSINLKELAQELLPQDLLRLIRMYGKLEMLDRVIRLKDILALHGGNPVAMLRSLLGLTSDQIVKRLVHAHSEGPSIKS